jgi:threonine dehydratase
MMTSNLRRKLHLNSSAQVGEPPVKHSLIDAFNFHKRLPGYCPSSLIQLPQVAEDIGVGSVYVKYEGNRLSLPSFKILGASWGAFRAVVQKLGLKEDSSIDAVKHAVASSSTKLVAATDGNHGRAIAYMGSVLGIEVEIFVPRALDSATVKFITGEGAQVTEVDGSYDLAVRTAAEVAGKSTDCILVQDTAFPGYGGIPKVSIAASKANRMMPLESKANILIVVLKNSGSWKDMAP